MLSKYQKSGILTGCADHLCLACENVLRSEQEVNAHIEKPIHKKNLDKMSYIECCAGEGIRKMKRGYFCERCNTVKSTMAKVNLHINEENHLLGKKSDEDKTLETQNIKWVRNAVIAFDDVLVDDKAWNGLIDDTCIVCDIEIDDWNIHKSEFGHNLKLVMRKVELGFDNTITRKIDDSAFQCLTCNTIVAANAMVAHVGSSQHLKQYIECRKAKQVHTAANNECVDETDTARPKDHSTGAIKKDANKTTGTKDTLDGKKFVDTANVKEKKGDLINQEDIKKFAKDNSITYNKDNNKAYCRICDIKVPSSYKNIKEHVEGSGHRSKIKLVAVNNPTKKQYETKPSALCILRLSVFENNVTCKRLVIVNNKYCIDTLSFMLITQNEKGFRCQMCERNLVHHPAVIAEHVELESHQEALKLVPVVVSFDKEFIREVRPGVFHCGYCNCVEAGWDHLQNHLKTLSHRRNRHLAELTTRRVIQQDMEESVMARLALFAMLHHWM